MINQDGMITPGLIISDDGIPYDVTLGRSFDTFGEGDTQLPELLLPADSITFSTTGQLTPAKTFGGTLTFADAAVQSPITVTFEFWKQGKLCNTKNVSVDMGEVYSSSITGLPVGTYSVLIKAGRPRLNRVVRNVVFTKTGTATPVTTTIYTGDCNGDGVVDAADVDYAISVLGATPSDPTWSTAGRYADLDNSEEVDAVDQDLVTANIGRTHDTV